MSSEQQHEEGGGDENWAISYADMMTLLCCFFIIMYIETADQEKVKKVSEKIAESMDEAKNSAKPKIIELSEEERKLRAFEILTASLSLGDNVEEVVGKIEQAAASKQNEESLKNVFKSEFDEDARKSLEKIRLGNSDHDILLTLVLPGGTTFNSGKATLLPEAAPKLLIILDKIKLLQKLITIEITGHTDSVPISGSGQFASNWDLSAARASTVAKFFIDRGIDGQKIKVRGAASFEPLFAEVNVPKEELLENQRRNRRVEIQIKKQKHELTSNEK